MIYIFLSNIPRKINFIQLGRYGRRGEQRYRQTFCKDFDWMCFNITSPHTESMASRAADSVRSKFAQKNAFPAEAQCSQEVRDNIE